MSWVGAYNAAAETAVGVSGDSTVDTRGEGDLVVTGRVMDATTRLGLANASVVLNGQTILTFGNGGFRIANAQVGAGTNLNVILAGYLSQTIPLAPQAEERAIDVGDVMLAVNEGLPVVASVKLNPNFVFINGFSPTTRLDIKVNWNWSHSGHSQNLRGRGVSSVAHGRWPILFNSFRCRCRVFAEKFTGGT